MNRLAKLMLDHSPGMLILVDPTSLQIVMASAAVCKTLGYDMEQLCNMEITDVESSLQDVFYWDDVRAGQHQAVQGQESEYRCANGALLTVRKSIQLLAHEGKPLFLVQAVPTQNERKVEDALAHTLSQLRATLESTGNGILVIDWRGRIDSMNRLFSSMWALPRASLEAQDDAGIRTFLCESVVESDLLLVRLDAILEGGETQDLFHHRDGRAFEVSSRPQYLGERIIGRVFGFHDVTQRMLAEEALRESRDQLEARVRARTADLNAANETLRLEQERQGSLIKRLEEAQNQLLQSERMASIGQLAAGVAHEINNPVGFVNSNLGSLQRYVLEMLQLLSAYERSEDALPAPNRKEIRQIKDHVDFDFLREDVTNLLTESLDGLKRVTRIVKDLKDFSHVDESELQWADLEAGIESTLRVVWNELKYKARVVKEFASVPPIECYPFQLNQVFMNLLVNASHALEEPGTITIRTGHDDTWVWIEVQDTGKGISPANLNRIFEPFFTTKPVGQGTGLGLSLSYGIVKKHDGRIEVTSEVGRGTTFKVILHKIRPAAGSLPHDADIETKAKTPLRDTRLG